MKNSSSLTRLCLYGRIIWFKGEEERIGCPDAMRRNFFLFLFRFRTVRNSKFSASRLWLRTDRCLMPWRFWQALCSGTGRHLLGLPGFFVRQEVCPKSWISGRKLRISNCSPESQKKEKVSPPGVRFIHPAAINH